MMATARVSYTEWRRQRDEQITALRREHPDWYLGALGKAFGLCRERMRQLLRRLHLPTKRVPRIYRCLTCNKEARFRDVQECRTCRGARAWVTLTCAECKQEFPLQASAYRGRQKQRARWGGVNADKYWCTRSCYGRSLGQRYGWGTRAMPMPCSHCGHVRGGAGCTPVEQRAGP